MRVMTVLQPLKNHGRYQVGKESVFSVQGILDAPFHGCSGLPSHIQDVTSTLMMLEILIMQLVYVKL